MKYLYGPVKSRRLGLSLGITLTPHKVCSFDCAYCQLGATTKKVRERKNYLEVNDIISELKEFLRNYGVFSSLDVLASLSINPQQSRRIDCISLSGFGEPTLHAGIASLIREVKKLVLSIPLALITNASLFSDSSLRRDVLGVDIIIPSLDAVTQDVFEQIDRPAAGIVIKDVIKGLTALRKEFKGEIFLEIMLIKGINDSLGYAHKFKEVIEKISPDKIQLNTPVRPTTEKWVEIPDKERLLEIKEILGDRCEII
jgi:wyosine [tRNA(Phe)-imidazoG37] synthetase (radical SAM superfamily)